MGAVILLLPGLIVFIAMILKPPEKVFQNFYLPILILLPQLFTFHINRIPDVSFAQIAIIPLFVLGFFQRMHRWKWSLTDFLIVSYVMETLYSEYSAEGLGSSAQLLTNSLTNIIFPYALAKILIHPAGYSISFAKTFSILIYTNILLTIYEQRFMTNPYINFFQRFFPNQGFEWPTITRYGFVRIAGPFIQPILMAIGCSMAFFLNAWVQRNGFWGKHYRYIPDLFIPKGWLFGIVIFIGLIFTFSRGPLLALALGYLFVGIAYSKYPLPSFIIRTSIFLMATLCISIVYDYYSGIGIELATSDQEMTLSYRTDLVGKYSDIIWQKPWFGWGSNSWPKVASTVSVDNQYLWLTLKHGFIAVILYGMIMANIVFQLLKKGLFLPNNMKRERSLNFTFLGLYLTLIFAFVTVYMGMQIEPLFYILTGWIQGYINTPPKTDLEWDMQIATPQKASRRAH